jgi:hypothetical protein
MERLPIFFNELVHPAPNQMRSMVELRTLLFCYWFPQLSWKDHALGPGPGVTQKATWGVCLAGGRTNSDLQIG